MLIIQVILFVLTTILAVVGIMIGLPAWVIAIDAFASGAGFVNYHLTKDQVASCFNDSYQIRKHMILLEHIAISTQNHKSYALNGFYNLSPQALIRAIPALFQIL